MVDYPAPYEFGLPEKFKSWYPRQFEAVQEVLSKPNRFFTGILSTGSGKSLTYMAAAQMAGYRTAILTGTKALQTQLLRDFAPMGLTDVRGKNAYYCLLESDGTRCNEGLCITGFQCPERLSKTCPYYRAIDRAIQSQLVITNYHFWMYNHLYGEGLGKFDLLVLDEAHNIPQIVADFLTVTLPRNHPVTCGFLPKLISDKLEFWQSWARETEPYVDKEIEYIRGQAASTGGRVTSASRSALAQLNSLKNSLTQIPKMDKDWILEISEHQIQFAPKWPKEYCEGVLFKNIPNVVFMSATVCKKTIDLLGVKPESNTIVEYPSTFPVKNRMLWHIPTLKMNNNNTDTDQKRWLSRIDQILDGRLDRKGIIHTVSYKRRDYLLTHSRHRDLMLSHAPDDLEKVVSKFKQSLEPAILVSPSLTTGYDFDHESCRFQIIGKVAFPDMSSPILKARLEDDPDYSAYLAIQSLIQTVGRATRAPDDWSENFIIDDNVRWILSAYKDFSPAWFRAAFKTTDIIPTAREL
ncbi:MAG: hypothetical protein EHM41_00140 [Chloroflexi bacterium]|nr:MAG: hypothetical protein EHM41_00140 [Chloroflexota bacterium]